MNINAIDHFGFRPLVVEMVLDAVRQVVGDVALLQDDVAPRRVDVHPVTSVPGDIGIAYSDDAIRLGDIYSWNC